MDKKYILISSLLACIILYYIEQVIAVNYGFKTLAKILLFTLIPYIYIRYIKRASVKDALNLKRLDKGNLKLGITFGIISFSILLLTYYVLRDFIDLSSNKEEMMTKSKITPGNFLLVGSYVTFGNSFLEEFFFRGFIFLSLYKLKEVKLAYIYSSVLFGLYHIAIFKNWFNIGLIILALSGLIGVAVIFNYLDTISENFINSWIVHILADSAIILIGLKMFGMI